MKKMISAGSIKNNYFLAAFTLISCAMFFSCNSDVVFEKNTTIHNSLWNRHEIVNFEVIIEDTAAYYNVFVNIRNKTDYAFSNLYLFLNTIYPDNQISRDTLEVTMADNTGKWLGKGWGKYRFLSVMLGEKIKFNQKGLYKFEFEQAMRTDTLENISDVGIKIQKMRF